MSPPLRGEAAQPLGSAEGHHNIHAHGHLRQPILGSWLAFLPSLNPAAAFGHFESFPYLLVGGRIGARLIEGDRSTAAAAIPAAILLVERLRLVRRHRPRIAETVQLVAMARPRLLLGLLHRDVGQRHLREADGDRLARPGPLLGLVPELLPALQRDLLAGFLELVPGAVGFGIGEGR